MLRAQAVAVTAEPDRKGAPEVSLNGRISHCRADTPSHCGWLGPEPGLLALFGVASRNTLFLRARQVAVDLGNVSWLMALLWRVRPDLPVKIRPRHTKRRSGSASPANVRYIAVEK